MAMDMDAKTDNNAVIQFDTTNEEISGRIDWSCQSKHMVDFFLKSEPNTKISTNDVALTFTIDKETVQTIWYLDIYPSYIDKQNDWGTQLFFTLKDIITPKSIEIVSLQVTRHHEIPQILFKQTKTADTYSIFGKNNNNISHGLPANTLSLQRFNKFDVVNNSGFMLHITFFIESIKYIKKTNISDVLRPQMIRTKVKDRTVCNYRISTKEEYITGEIMWRFQSKPTISYFMDCKVNKNEKIESKNITVSFMVNNELIKTIWSVVAYPNIVANTGARVMNSKVRRNGGSVVGTVGASQVYLQLVRIINQSNTVNIVSIDVSYDIIIPQIAFRCNRPSITFVNDRNGIRTCKPQSNRLSLKRFEQFNVYDGGFDIFTQFRVDNIQFRYKNGMIKGNFKCHAPIRITATMPSKPQIPNPVKIEPAPNAKNAKHPCVASRNIGAGGDKDPLALILTVLESLDCKISSISARIDSLERSMVRNIDNEEKREEILANNYKDIGKNENKLKCLLVSVFGDNDDVYEDYLNIIKSEGFDDVLTFCELDENRLKEIGIKKMGHRMKLLKAMDSYKSQHCDNDRVAPGAAVMDTNSIEGA